MGTVIGIIALIVVGPYLVRQVSQARSGAWAGPRTAGMKSRAVSGRQAAARSAGTRPSGALGRAVEAHVKGKADVARLVQKAHMANWLEAQRHARKTGTAASGEVTPAPPVMPLARKLKLAPLVASRGGDGAASGPVPVVPPPPFAREPRAQRPPPAATTWTSPPPAPQERVGTGGSGISPGPGNGAPPAHRSPPPAPAPPATTTGGTVSAGTSTASAEKAIEGVNEIYAHGMAGGIHAKQEALKAMHELAVRAAQMAVTFARQMSEPGQNYGTEITEPLATAGTHYQAAASSVSESDAAISTLINMSVGDLAASARQAPHHSELSESGSR